MVKDLSNSKCTCGEFSVTSNSVRSIKIPADAKGVKIYSFDDIVFFNVNDNPGTQTENALTAGGFAVDGVTETRILQDGTERELRLKAKSATTQVLVEFWG